MRRISRQTARIDVLGKAVGRLAILAFIVWAVMFAIMVGLFRAGDEVPHAAATRAVVLAALIASLLVFVLCQLRRIPSRRTLDIGLVWSLIVAYAIAFQENAPPWPEDGVLRGVSLVCVWVVTIAALIPGSFARTATAAILAAAMSPIALAITVHVLGNPAPSQGIILWQTVPNALSALLAVVVWKMIHGWQVALLAAEQHMGSYELEEKLGAGAMGEVWRARHRLLIRPAAVKLIRPKALGTRDKQKREVLIRRFQREARATAALQSPHTIQLYDFGVADDGTLYYAMELLDGLDLQTLIARHGPVPPERAVHFLRQICHSLAEAHDAGLVHRDIKPHNVFACRRGRDVDVVKVLDFGLVRVQDVQQADTRLTAANRTIGSPAYMAPEAMMAPRDADARADIYSVGCVGYWLLTGQLVFSGTDATKVALRHLNESAQPPSARAPVPLPAELDQVILDCLHKEPGDRVPSAVVLDARLATCPAEFPWDGARAKRWWTDNAA